MWSDKHFQWANMPDDQPKQNLNCLQTIFEDWSVKEKHFKTTVFSHPEKVCQRLQGQNLHTILQKPGAL